MGRRWNWAAALAGVLVILHAATPAAADPTSPPGPSAHAVPPGPSAHAVPPAAPKPTADGASPDAPDPSPPRGGIGPDGKPVGGAELLGRGILVPATAPALPRSLTAAAFVLADLDSGDVLAARDPHGRYQPASILKTLTTVTLLPLLPGRRVVTASRTAAETEGSHAGLVPGGRYTVDQLFAGLLLVSGNDAAAALADAAGGVRHTVDLMNATALRLGAYDTFVQTPSGLDGWQQLTSAYDMAIFLRAAAHQPRFVAYNRELSAELPRQKVNGFGPVPLANQNETFLRSVPGALIAKTGFTDAAQHTFVGAIARNGRRLGVVFLRAQRWPKDQWQQAVDLMNWGFALPPTTAPVGHLDPAVLPPAPNQTARGVEASAAGDTSTSAGTSTGIGTASGTGSGRGSGSAVPLTIAGVLVLAAGLIGWRVRRAR